MGEGNGAFTPDFLDRGECHIANDQTKSPETGPAASAWQTAGRPGALTSAWSFWCLLSNRNASVNVRRGPLSGRAPGLPDSRKKPALFQPEGPRSRTGQGHGQEAQRVEVTGVKCYSL